jgi:hypothetical protein
MDQWASLSQGLPSPRTEALITLDPFICFQKGAPCDIPGQGAIRVGKYKLIHGTPGKGAIAHGERV